MIGGGETGAGPADPQAYYDDLVVKHAARTGVNVDFLRAQIDAESSWNPKAIGAGRGAEDRAIGIAQILRSEAEKAGVDPYNPDHAIGYMADRAVKALKKYKGNYREVAGQYHGWNQRGAPTRTYQDRVMKFFKQRKPGKRADFSLISSAQAEELPAASPEFTLSDEVVGATPSAEPAAGPASPPSDFTISDEIIGGPTPAAAAESPFFLERLPKPEQPEPEGIAPIPDYLLAFGKGVVGLGEAAYGLTDVLTGGMIDRATGLVDDEPMSVKFQRTNQILLEMQSPAMQAKIKNLEQQKGFFNSAWTAVSDPALLAEMMLGSGAFMLGGAAVARGAFVGASAAARAAGLMRGLTVEAANKVAVKQGIKAATLANIGYNGVMEGASTGLDMKVQILTMPEEKLGPVYENLKAEHGPAQARLILAETAQAQVTAIAGVIAAGATALTGAGKFEAELFTGQAFKNKPGRILREMLMGAKEIPEEATQNVGDQLAQNIAARNLDPTQDITQGLPEAAGTGVAFGLGAGIGFGAMRGVTARREEAAPAAPGGIAPSRAPLPAEEVLGREEVSGPVGAAPPPAAGSPVPPPAAQPMGPTPTAPAVPEAVPIAGLSKADMNRARLRKMAEERRRIDMSNDTLLMAVAKLGGANIAHRFDITGDDKNMKVGPFMWVFTSKGLGVDDLATQLGQYGYLSEDELSDVDGGVQALRDKIRDEFNGLTKHYSLHKDIETFDAVKRRAQEAEQDDKAFVTAAELEKDFAAQGLEISNDNLVDYSIVEQASAIDSDAVERLSIQHEDNDAGFMAAIEELIRERSRQETGGRGIEAPAEPAKPAEPAAEELALTGETEAEAAAAERDRTLKAAEEAKARTAAEAKAKADVEAKAGLVLTGSERAADIAVAAGQQGLFVAPPPAPTIADIHAKADSLGIKWDDDPAFMDRTEALTGKRRLDFLSGPERKIVFDALEKPAPAAIPTPVVTPKPEPKPKPAPKTGDLFGVDAAAAEAATSPTNEKPEPTEGQKEEGNYPKGHWRVRGLDISIENPAGSRRRPEWPELKSHYGYIRRTEGKDGDQVDVFVKPGTSVDFDGPVFIVDQNKDNGHFDEHKVMLGWPTVENARAAYLENYTPDWDRIRAITSVTMDEFKDWLTHPEVTSKEPASDTFAFAREEKIGFEEIGKQKVKRAAAAKLAQNVREAEREIRRMALTFSDVATAAELPLAEFRQRAHDAVRLWVATERESADKSGDVDRVAALAGAKLEGEFYDSIYRELRKSVRAAEIEKNRDPAIYQAALAAAMVEENISNDAAMQAAFKGGFDHAIAGNTKSTLIGDLLGVRSAGYDRAMAWMSKDEGRNYFQGKRGKKLEGTGAALRRWFDDAKKTIAGAKGSPEAFLAEIEKATTRADAFKVEMAPGATPGLARWLDDVRGQFLPFKEWAIKRSTRLRRYGGSPTESIIYYLKDDADRTQNELRELAETYVTTLTKLAGLLSGKANIAQAAEAFDAAVLGSDGSIDKSKPLYEGLHSMLRRSWRFSGFGSKTWQTKTAIGSENTADLNMRKQPLIRPRLDKISREGRKDYRKGRNVTPKEFKETFGFADVGFGKWVGTKADQDHLNYAFDAFMDLADILGLKPKDISLGGTLYFSIGALGHGRASAHFAPEQPHPDGGTVPVINVTSTRGDGTVAHEWHHALDFHLRPKAGGKELIGDIKKELQYRYDFDQVRAKVISALKGELWWTGMKKDRVASAREAIRYYGQRRRDSKFFSHAKNLGEDYWASPNELFARASEAWVYDTMEGENPYLVSDWVEEGKVKAPVFRGTPYPEGEERIRFAGLYKAMYQVLDWTEAGPVVNRDKLAAWPDHRKFFLDAVAALELEIPDLVIQLASEEKYKKLEAESKKHAEEDAIRAAAEAITVTVESNARPGEDDLSTLFDEAAAELREGTQEQPNAPTPGESGTIAKPFKGGDKVQFREGTNKQIYEVWIVSEDGARIKIHEPAPKVWRMAGDFVAVNEDVQALLSGRGGKISTTEEKRVGALAAEAAKLGVQGVDEALKGLVKLFGGNKIKSFPAGLDKEAYEQAKPHFEAALKAFQAAGRTLKDLFKFLIQNFGEGIKPYAIAFAQEKQLSTELTEATVESASMKVAKRVAEWLSAGQVFKADQLFRLADVAFGGTQAQGVYTSKDAFDAMEAGVQLYLRQGQWGARPETSPDHARRDLENMERFLATLPTQTKRTAETDEFQQFSTPPTLAYIANWAANVRYGETYLEPSAGIGGLAIFGEGAGARIILNELSQRRAAVLREIFPRARVFSENAEQLHNILPDDVSPTVIVMNPPFSSTAGRIQGARDSRTGAQHLEQALARLAPGGRLVAIMGDGMNEQAALLKDWWARMRSQYNFRANVSISGDNYVKYGTTFDNRIIVVDKTGPTSGEVLVGRAEKLAELFDLLSEIRNDRQNPATSEAQPGADQQGGARPAGEGRPDVGGAGAQPGGDLVDAMGAVGGVAGGAGVGALGGKGEGARPGRPGGGVQIPGKPGGRPGDKRRGVGGAVAGGRGAAGVGVAVGDDGGATPVTIETAAVTRHETELTDAIFESYKPQRLTVPGSKTHPGELVESAAMSAVEPPAPTYQPNLPEKVIRDGLLSDAQIETVVYAGQAFQDFLPNGDRKGYFIGDGCVAAGTRIFNPVAGTHTPIEVLAQQGAPHWVLSLTENGFRPHRAVMTFKKGVADLYRVTLDDGRVITVTDEHRFLTPQGWCTLRDRLATGDLLACGHRADATPHASGDAYVPCGLRRAEDCLDHCWLGYDRRDALLPLARGIYRQLSPSPIGACAHTRLPSHTDGQEPSPSHICRGLCALHHAKSSYAPSANRDLELIEAQNDASPSPQLATTRQAIGQSRVENDSPALLETALHQSAHEGDYSPIWCEWSRRACARNQLPLEASHRGALQALALARQIDTRPAPLMQVQEELSGAVSSWERYSVWRRISSIEFVGRDDFYDMYVPGPENYLAEGFVNHNTGVGKGREISGIILDHFRQGQKKAVWVSEKQGLIKDAQRDFSGVTGDPDLIFAQSKTAFGEDVKGNRGILFTTYSTLRSVAKLSEEEKKARVMPTPGRADQIVKWVGEDFDGVVVFDEAHAMANAQSVKGKRGATKASAQALAGIDLQKRLPKARIVYVSATGATEVFNLAYASRLGLWGEGTPFAKSEDFISKIDAAGVSAMEIVAQNMKQMGVYVARSLSFRGVKYDQLPHDLTPLQTDIYNELARAWQIVLANINAALAITNQEKDSQSKSRAKSQFWSSQQRFFNQIITAMQMPSVIDGIKADMAAGRAAILQFVNTNEAEQERQAARIAQGREDDDTEIEEFDFTPRQTLLELIRKSFPVNQYEEYKDENGNVRSRPVLDSKGEPVQNKEAVAMRDALLKTLEEIRVPDNPLDMVVEIFGSDAVAEISGRKRRFVRVRDNDGDIKLTEQKRGSSSNEADKQAFLDGKKNILVFTDAGGTGYSFHADLNFKNQKLRRHYLVQSGWRADKAVQGLGRSHRTNQKQPPEYVLPRTNLKAQKRFISSIARRLDQLGALTKGQRQAASQGVFSPADNLENKYARMGLRAFLEDLVAGSTGLEKNKVLRMMGLEGIVDDQGQLVEAKMPPITQFLNCLLSLEVHVQDEVFDEFFRRIEAATESAIQNGTFDDGLQTIKALSTTKTRDIVVHTDKKTGAVTRYVELNIERPTPFFNFDAVAELTEDTGERFASWYLDNKTGKVFALFKRGSRTDEFGRQVNIGLRIGPSKRSYNDDFDNITMSRLRVEVKVMEGDKTVGKMVPHFEPIAPDRARSLWADETARTPKTYTETEHMITGAMLPIWDRLPETVRVARTQTKDGERLLGRLIQKKELNETLKKLGVGSKFTEMKPAQWFAEIKAGAKAILANGWQIKMAKVSGEQRMEISGLSISYSDQRLLVEQGVIHERIQWKDRLFIPVDRPDIFGRIVEGKPVIDLIGAEGEEAALSRAARIEPGLPRASVQAMVDRLTRNWKGAPEIVVVETPRSEGVPSGLLDLITVKGAVDTAEGAFHEGKIYLFSRHMRDAGRVQFVILHEATHFGLRGIFGEAIDPLLMEIYRGNENVKTAVRDLKLQYRDLTTMQATEEVLADLGGKAVELSGWERLVSFIRNWLRAHGFTLEYSIGDIRALVESAGRFTREGRVGTLGPSVFSGDTQAAEEAVEDFALSRISARPADRIDEYRFERATDKRGLPIYHNEHIGLAGAVEEGKSANTRMMLFKIYDTAMSVKAGAPAEIGFVRSEIDGDGNFVNVHSIRISDFYQQSDKGYGEDVIASMLASNAPGKSLEIVDIVVRPDEDVLPGQAKKDARGFWQKLGTVFRNLSNDPDVPMYGFLTLSGYVQARGTARLSRGGGQKPSGLEAPRRTGLLDILLRAPMQAIGLEKITSRSYDFLLGRIGAFVPEGMKAGLVSDYGLTLDYIERRDQAFVNVRRGERDIKTIVDALTMLDRAQSRVAYQWMTQNETEGDRLLSDLPAESQAVLVKVKGMIVDMGREAVRLGQLGQDSFERNVMSYLHRTYAKYELADEGAVPAHRRAISILGEQYKGRGMTQEVTMAKIRNAAPEWWERKVQSGRADKGLRGMKFIRFDRRANRGEGVEPLPGMGKTGQLGKILEVVYWPAEHPVPAKFGEWHRDEGLWEARDTKGDKLLMWRDFTKAEREKMGELDDVKYSVAKTLHMMQRDLEVGRFLEWLASHYAKPEPEGEIAEASERLSKAYRPGTWVHVPVSKVPGTNTLRYGKLAGLYVPGPIWNDIRQIANQNYRPFGRLYGNVVKWFKISKTALSPVVHMNNVMANFIFADVEDITGRDLWDSMKVYLEAQSGDEKAKLTIQRFEDSGATSGMFVTHELQQETVRPLLAALREEVQAGSADVVEEAVAFLSALAHGKLKESATRLAVSRPAEWARRGANAMMDAYQFEDEFFRLAVFLRETAAGKSDLEAGKTAKQAFLDYNINAPWIQAARHTALPFISFSYRALPRLLHGFSRKPWKLAKYMLVAGGLNAIAYAMLGLSDDDEERERAFLPDEKAGRIWGIVPKLIRMPWNDQSDQPVFLDVRRWIPLGDIFDTGETQAAIPFVPTLVPGGPLAIIGEIIFNKSLFTGKPITNRETDTMAEISGKISEHVYKSFAPNAPWIPFSYAGTALVRAGTGRTDVFGREQSFAQAGLSSFGIKVSSYAPDVMQRNAAIELQIQIGQIKSIMYQLAREYSRHGMGRDDYEKKMAYQREKMERLTREFAAKK